MIGEIGSMEYGTGVKAAWLTDVLTTQLPYNFPKVKAVVWWNWRFLQSGVYQRFENESSTSSMQAFRTGIASSYYMPGGGLGNLPPLDPVPVP